MDILKKALAALQNPINQVGKTMGQMPVMPGLSPAQSPNMLQAVQRMTPLVGGQENSPASSFLSGQVQNIPGQIQGNFKQSLADSSLIGQSNLDLQQQQRAQMAIANMVGGGGGGAGRKMIDQATSRFGQKLIPYLENQGKRSIDGNVGEVINNFIKGFSTKTASGRNKEYDDLVKLASYINAANKGAVVNKPF